MSDRGSVSQLGTPAEAAIFYACPRQNYCHHTSTTAGNVVIKACRVGKGRRKGGHDVGKRSYM